MTTNTTINYAKLADDAADTYTSARDRLSKAISRAAKNMQGRIKNGLGTLGN